MNILIAIPSDFESNNLQLTSSKHNIDVVVCGIGGFSTTYTLTKYCITHKPDFIIHGGICGSFSQKLPIGQVVQVQKDSFSDCGVFENNQWQSIFDMGLISSSEFPFSQGWLIAPNYNTIFQKVTAITSQTITSNINQRNLLIKHYNPEIESMEGACVHFVCLKESIPFIHLRSISNMVGVRDKSQWNTDLAIKNLHNAINNVICKL